MKFLLNSQGGLDRSGTHLVLQASLVFVFVLGQPTQALQQYVCVPFVSGVCVRRRAYLGVSYRAGSWVAVLFFLFTNERQMQRQRSVMAFPRSSTSRWRRAICTNELKAHHRSPREDHLEDSSAFCDRCPPSVTTFPGVQTPLFCTLNRRPPVRGPPGCRSCWTRPRSTSPRARCQPTRSSRTRCP